MKLTDVKYILPRMKHSTHTPKMRPYTEGYFMKYNSIKDVINKKTNKSFCQKACDYLMKQFSKLCEAASNVSKK